MRRLLWLLLLGAPLARGADFSFWQLSDLHSPVPGSGPVVAAASPAAAVTLQPYGLTAPRPAFALLTGDLTEFGPGRGAWAKLRGYFERFDRPLYHTPGNHDNTWWLLRPELARLRQAPPYTFSYGGLRLIVLDSASRQDPRPSIAAEELVWLRRLLAQVDRRTPLVLVCHHPLQGSEWASGYDTDRLLEALAEHNVVVWLVGHGHSARRLRFGDHDATMGGSTFDGKAPGGVGGNAGYAVIDLRDGRLRVAYKKHAEPTASVELLDKSLAAPTPLPAVRWIEPSSQRAQQGEQVTVRIHWPAAAGASGTAVGLSGEPQSLRRAGDTWSADLPLRDAPPGRYVVRLLLSQGERRRVATREFTRRLPGGAEAVWRRVLPGSLRGALAVDAEQVYACTQDGLLQALRRRDGGTQWTWRAGGEVIGGVRQHGNTLLLAATDGRLSALGRNGQVRWQHDCGRPLVAPATVSGDLVVVGGIDGAVTAVDLVSGRRRWQQPLASYTIETAVVASGARLYLGSWDTYVQAFNRTDGKLLWRVPGAGSSGSAPGVAPYYAPADCAPVVLAGRVYGPDRAYQMGLWDATDGQVLGKRAQVGAAALSADGRAIYLRQAGQGGSRLTKLDARGEPLWSTPLPGGFLPVPPVERDGLVAFSSDSGLVSAVDPASGKLRWQYRAAPGSWLMGGAQPAGGTLYVGAHDGSVTAVTGPGQGNGPAG
ncbi:MAG: PQQ-binding-like beta-propeller repeat protein [Fimbriimonadaceae bacterium]|nr:PQQ-binding-like beta-propeller repeat protein [Fimbriimonadaceae bacterium]